MLTTASYGWLQDFYNFLKDDAGEDATTAMVSTTTAQRQRSTLSSFSFRRKNGYSGYLESTAAASAREGGFDGFMNTVIKKKLGIIPKNLSYVRHQSQILNQASYVSLLLCSERTCEMTTIHPILLCCCLHCRWGEQSGDVFDAMAGDFMKPRIQEVDQLLELGVNITIYNGQVTRNSIQ